MVPRSLPQRRFFGYIGGAFWDCRCRWNFIVNEPRGRKQYNLIGTKHVNTSSKTSCRTLQIPKSQIALIPTSGMSITQPLPSLLFKVSRHSRPIRRIAWTKREHLYPISGIAIVIKSMTRIHIQPGGPRPQLIPRATLAKLTSSNPLHRDGGYGSVVGVAHDVLPETVDTVQDTVDGVIGDVSVGCGGEGFANELLQKEFSGRRIGGGDVRTRQWMLWKPLM